MAASRTDSLSCLWRRHGQTVYHVYGGVTDRQTKHGCTNESDFQSTNISKPAYLSHQAPVPWGTRQCPVVRLDYCNICLRVSKMFRLNASSTLIGCVVVASATACVGDVVDDDSDVTVLFLFFLSALFDSIALVTSPKPAVCTQHQFIQRRHHHHHNHVSITHILQRNPEIKIYTKHTCQKFKISYNKDDV